MNRIIRLLALGAVAVGLGAQTPPQPAPAAGPPRTPPPGYEDVYAGKKRLLIIADLSTGNQTAHMAVSHAVSVIEQIGRQSGAYVSFIRTDTDWITKGETWGKGLYAKGGPKQARGRNLDYFDAVLFYTNGELNLSETQKRDLLDFVSKDGKGFIGVHTATATAPSWPEYAEMLGGAFDNHPWMIANARIIVERPDFPAMKPFRTGMTLRDEHYQMLPTPYARDKVDVLARLDTRSVNLAAPMVHRKDGDFPVAWIKGYGSGRVFYTGLGHTDAAWDDPRIRTMMVEAIRWAINGGQTARPHPISPNPKPAP
ncbi:ThuA domain-containing protein [Novosphingobium sp. FSY-8]|uniref:ThuA domain-containing protein n=1 Tax=Novosphingobium ovatum TaxID=1908523 RepID=A0ABW9XCB4_9SPHN|nr:ThuA domain-containing protein [Novosphingobium ovatum]NBC36184.1 ThuA domain-containing protein [Novosphingobium ovatum]